ncbi:MAG: aminomethyl-transferring glycine dehydrogenase subunit GcvPA [Limnochordia bacterium]|nr:aminomethyl-transferring glycine dehydrogenase subunit GcvPA [Limnochordia bacterium]
MHAYIPHTQHDRREMLNEIGVSSAEELFDVIPRELQLGRPLNLPQALSEQELLTHMNALAEKNKRPLSFLGAGAYEHHIPSVVNHILMRSEFYTSYTPYQAEISQGMLQCIFEYQTMIAQITGMDVSNASLYDGATATSEAAFMAVNVTRRNKVLVPWNVHPQTRQVLRTYCNAAGITLIELENQDGLSLQEIIEQSLDHDTAGVILQNPDFFGCIEDLQGIADIVHNNKSLLIASVEPISLALLKPPGQSGVDIAVGDGQSLGNPLSFGGPSLGFMAVKENLLRRMPGRIVGQTKDQDGRRGFVLTLQAREQHIRRQKAMSNICSNQALNALAATVYLATLGKEGFVELATLCMNKAHYAKDLICAIPGFELAFDSPFFCEFAIKCPGNAENIAQQVLQDAQILPGYYLGQEYPELSNGLLIAVTETKTRQDIELLADALAKAAVTGGDLA